MMDRYYEVFFFGLELLFWGSVVISILAAVVAFIRSTIRSDSGIDLISKIEQETLSPQQTTTLQPPSRWTILKTLAGFLLRPSGACSRAYRSWLPQSLFFPSAFGVIHQRKTGDPIKVILRNRPRPTVITISASDFAEYKNFEAKPIMSGPCPTCGAVSNSYSTLHHCTSLSGK